MDNNHIDYSLRRIRSSDRNKSFITTEESFNTPSKTLHEYVKQDKECSKNGEYISYVFDGKSNILGIARMKPLDFEIFQFEIRKKNLFKLEEIEQYHDMQIIYMSRAGVAQQVDGLGWGTMLRSFLDGHARSVYKHFLLYALINEEMYKSMLKRYGKEFYKIYKVSNKHYDKEWGWYWAILREFSPP